MGTIAQDEEAQLSIQLANPGTLPLAIKDVEPSRFCSANANPKIIAPGESGQLDVTCRSDLHGALHEVLLLNTNDPSAEKVPVEILAKVTPRLAFEVSVVNLEMPFGEERSQDVRLIGTLVNKAALEIRQSLVGQDSKVTPLPSPKGFVEAFRIRCLGKKVGTNAGNLFVSTGLPNPKEIAIPYACKVRGTLELSPTNPYFNMKLPGPKLVPITVRSTQPGFVVHGANVIEGPFEATTEGPGQDGGYQVIVRVLEARIPEDSRGVRGTLVVDSNDRTEPRKEIPLFAFGRREAGGAETPTSGR